MNRSSLNPNSDAGHQARLRLDRLQHFRAELADLERDGVLVLNDDQRTRLDAHVAEHQAALELLRDAEGAPAGQRIALGMRITALLGSAAFFAALVLFLHRIWGSLPNAAQFVILVSIPMLLLGAAEVSYRRRVASYYTALLVIAASVGFVMELSALGALFNLTPTPQVLLAWGSFSVLMGYAYGLRLPLAAGLILLGAYSASLWVAAAGEYWSNFLDRPESMLPAAAIVYAVPSIGPRTGRHESGWICRVAGGGMGLLGLMLLSLGGDGSYLPLLPRTVETLYQVVGLLVSAGIIYHGTRLGRPGLVNLGSGAFVIFLYVKLHFWWWDWMPKYLFFLLIGLIAMGLLYVFRRLRAHVAERRVR